jgi:alkanesulfonate monooxygenase SsuD/methylene tetrahydromethanopterin reductase-like flavin-dependent oxidoreductase (luciferase family)
MARLGVGILIIPQKPWHEVAKELDTYRTVYRQVNGVDAPPPISAGWTFCDPSPERARDMARRYIGGYYQTVLDHYQFAGDHLSRTKGSDYFVNLQVSGTPEHCYERIVDIHRRTGNSHYVGVFSYAGMPPDEAERNMRLFAAEVLPELRKLAVTPPASPEPVAPAVGKDVRALGF